LRSKLDQPELVERFVSTFRERVASRSRARGPKDETDRRVRDCERRIANLTESLAKIGWSEALATKLREEESQLARRKAERSAASRTSEPRTVPHPTVIAGYFRNLVALLETDSVRGREVLSRFVSPVVMTPEGEGPARRYRATGAFNLAFFLSPARLEGAGVVVKSSCAGRI
jgi:hypothetical protein